MTAPIATDHLTVTTEERAIGITSLQAVTFKRATIVVAESTEGYVAFGHNAPWPKQEHVPHVGLSIARRAAVDRMMQIRARSRAHREPAGA